MNFDTVLIIGLGGTGSNLMPTLSRLLLNKKFTGNIYLADGDSYSESNLERQIFSEVDGILVNKAEYQAKIIETNIPQLSSQLTAIPQYLSKEDVEDIVRDGTLVINCADNLAIRKYVEDRVATLDNACHVCCGNEMKSGQVQIYLRKNGQDITPSIYKNSPIFNSENDDRSKMSCQDLAALPSGGQLICANNMAAAIALNIIYWLLSDEDIYMGCAYIPAGTTLFNCANNKVTTEDCGVFDPAAFKLFKQEKKEREAVLAEG